MLTPPTAVTLTSRRRRGPAIALVTLLLLAAACVGYLALSLTVWSPPTDEADGNLPDGTTVTDQELPGIAKLEPELRDALHRATADAAEDGVQIEINSGWRSAAFQDYLFERAIDTYGSREVAAQWVATAETSAHVTGDAVDISPYDAIDWLSRHGDRYGLCQIYGTEAWHFELRPDAAENGCPPTFLDPSHDPRLQPDHESVRARDS